MTIISFEAVNGPTRNILSFRLYGVNKHYRGQNVQNAKKIASIINSVENFSTYELGILKDLLQCVQEEKMAQNKT